MSEGGSRRSRISRASTVEAAIVLVGYLGLACWLTWPVAIHPGAVTTSGHIGGDPLGYLVDLWYHGEHGFSFWGTGVQDQIARPFGRPVSNGGVGTQLAFAGPAWILTKFFSAIVAYNVVLIFGIAASSAAMYLLVRKLGLGSVSAGWAGMAFMLFQYHLARIASHPPLALLWCFPLLLLAGVFWLERRDNRSAILLGVALLGCWVSNPYYGIMGFLMIFIIGVIGIVMAARSSGTRGALRAVAQVSVPAFVLVVLPLIALALAERGTTANAFTRSRVELEIYGARLSDYLIPSLDPLTAGITPNATWLRPGGERANFLGLATIPLAVIGLVVAVSTWKRLAPRLRLALTLAIPIGLASVWFSLASPYPILGRRVEMPSSFIFDVLPYLRAYARFVVPVMTVALVIAAFGLQQLMRRRSQIWQISIASTAFLVTGLNLVLGGPIAAGVPGSIDGIAPRDRPTWKWLATNAPGQVVLETPGGPDEELDRWFAWAQSIHRHPIANGSFGENNPAADFLDTVGDPQQPGAATRLATAGISLVAIERWAWDRRGRAVPVTPPPGFRVLTRFPDGSAIWRVTAPATAAIAIYRRAYWWTPVQRDGDVWRFLGVQGRLATYAPQGGRYLASFATRGYLPGAAYRLRFTLPDGHTEERVIRDSRRITLPMTLAAGQGEVTVTNLGPPARQISQTDLRVVSVELGEWKIVAR